MIDGRLEAVGGGGCGGQLGVHVLHVELAFELSIAALDLVDAGLEIEHDLLELLRAHFQVDAVLHLEIDETRRQEHQVMRVGVDVVLGHFGALILMHAANVAERAGHDDHGAIAVDDVDVAVDVLAHDLGLAAVRTVHRELGTHEHVMPLELRQDKTRN